MFKKILIEIKSIYFNKVYVLNLIKIYRLVTCDIKNKDLALI